MPNLGRPSVRNAEAVAGPMYILMLDKKGWKSLADQHLGLDLNYLSQTGHYPEVDVPKGSLVERVNGSPEWPYLKVRCVEVVEQQHSFDMVTLLVTNKDIQPLEEAEMNMLKPLPAADRYDILTDPFKYRILTCQIGDSVIVAKRQRTSLSFSHQDFAIGLIRYIGTLDGLEPEAIWFGVEFIDGSLGKCDGTLGQKRYFTAPPFSSIFTSANRLMMYPENGLEQWPTAVSGTVPRHRKLSTRTNGSCHPGPDHARQHSTWERTIKSPTWSQLLHLKQEPTAARDRNRLWRRPPEKTSIQFGEVDKLTADADAWWSGGGSSPPAGLELHDRVIWLSENHGLQMGSVRWIGKLPHQDSQSEWMAGIEFDNAVGSGNGTYNRRRLFQAKMNHGMIMPVNGLIKADDYEEGGSMRQQGVENSSLVAKLKAAVAPGNDEEGNTMKTLSPVGQFRRMRSPRQMNRISLRKDDDDHEGLQAMPTTPRASPARPVAPAHSSPTSVVASASSDPVARDLDGHMTQMSLSNQPTRRDPYASEQIQVQAEVHTSFDLSEADVCSRVPSPEFECLHARDAPHLARIEVGCLVQLRLRKSDTLFGVIKWIGFLMPDKRIKMAGIELEEELSGAGNGWHNGSMLFDCPDKKGVFVPLTHVQLDSRFEAHLEPALADGPDCNESRLFGHMECPLVPGFQTPIHSDKVGFLCGRNRGIQGHQNSCYLDATLFAMFTFTSVFDCLLYRPATPYDIPEYGQVQRVLREEIVNPLRKNYFVRADRVMKLRELLDSLSSVKGLLSEEKDPEELLHSLLSQTLKASPFLELSSGQTSHLYQLFVERDEAKLMPTVQELFEQSFLTSGVKLTKVPSVLILQMPRFGRQFKVYDRILPSQLLDVTDIIEDAPRQCIVCGKLARFECADCYGQHGSGLDSTAFCYFCLNKLHNHAKRRHHKAVELKIPEEFHDLRSGCENRRLFMELFAVVCIETSHYVSFVKCGLGPDAPWCFFDSMADRKGEQFGYNIPEVTLAPDVSHWLTEEGVALLRSVKDDKALPDQAKRLICDAYMCFYQSPEVMMYH